MGSETVLCIIGSNGLVTLSVNTPGEMQECTVKKKDTGLCCAFVCALERFSGTAVLHVPPRATDIIKIDIFVKVTV